MIPAIGLPLMDNPVLPPIIRNPRHEPTIEEFEEQIRDTTELLAEFQTWYLQQSISDPADREEIELTISVCQKDLDRAPMHKEDQVMRTVFYESLRWHDKDFSVYQIRVRNSKW